MLGSPQHPLPRRVCHHEVLAAWGDPWDMGSTPPSGFAHRAGLAPPQPPRSTLPTPASRLHTQRDASQGLAPSLPPKLWGPIQPLAPGGSSLLHSAWRATSWCNPTIRHPASAATPGPSRGQQNPASSAPRVREAPALAMGVQVFAGGPWGTQAGTCRGPTGCYHLGKQNQPTRNRSHPAPQKHSLPPDPLSLLPSEGHRGPGAPNGCTGALGPETCALPSPSPIE